MKTNALHLLAVEIRMKELLEELAHLQKNAAFVIAGPEHIVVDLLANSHVLRKYVRDDINAGHHQDFVAIVRQRLAMADSLNAMRGVEEAIRGAL